MSKHHPGEETEMDGSWSVNRHVKRRTKTDYFLPLREKSR